MHLKWKWISSYLKQKRPKKFLEDVLVVIRLMDYDRKVNSTFKTTFTKTVLSGVLRGDEWLLMLHLIRRCAEFVPVYTNGVRGNKRRHLPVTAPLSPYHKLQKSTQT